MSERFISCGLLFLLEFVHVKRILYAITKLRDM